MSTRRAPAIQVAAAAISLLWVAAAFPGGGEPRLHTEDSVDSEGGTVTGCVWLASGCRLRFVPPKRWSVQCQQTNTTILLAHPEYKVSISMALHRESETTNRTLDAAFWQSQVEARYPQAKLLSATACTVAGREGRALEFTKTVNQGVVALVRVVVAPYPLGVAEFEMRTTRTDERLARRAMRGLLTSLSIETLVAEESPPR